jgi:NAD(P)H-dependent FMN reductase
MTDKPLKILTILGSTREGRFGETVAKWFNGIADAREDFQNVPVDLRDIDLPFLSAPGTKPEDYDIERWRELVGGADGFVVITPEYNHSIPAVLKNAIDHLNKEWNNKPIAVLSYGAGAGGSRAAEHLRQIAIELQMAPIREGIHIVMARLNFDEQGQPKDDAMAGRVDTMLAQLVWWGKALRAARG